MTWKVYVRTKSGAADSMLIQPEYEVEALERITLPGTTPALYVICANGRHHFWNWDDVLDVAIIPNEEPAP